jgi:DNA mismatch repair protein MutL
MNRIRVLSPDVSQKIAAGEVIERPASVVKELVENAVDAGAGEVAVELAGGGKSLIRVRDDGCGMSRSDAELAFVRHSTSKIATEDDLLAIATLGFRGEALASISAVSRLTLRTSEGGDEVGTEVRREADAVLDIRDVACPRGTTIEVRDLFFNLPARLKFLRGDSSELGQVAKYLTQVALAYPRLRLSASHGGRSVLNCPPVESLRERIFQLFGAAALDRLIEVAEETSVFQLAGFASRPPEGRRDRTRQFFFVNRRPVRDKVLASALNQAFRGYLEKELSPEAYLFLTVPFADVDVNVHPAKAEVRFRDSSAVFVFLVKAIERARLRAGGIKVIVTGRAERAGGTPPEQFGLDVPFKVAEDRGTFKIKEEAGSVEFPAAASSKRRVLGQFANAYIVAEDADGLLIVDQHNAHERMLFEKYAEIDRQKKWPLKLSLVPPVFDLAPSQVVALESARGALGEAGFRVEEMGGRSYALLEYPGIFGQEEALQTILEVLEDAKDAAGQGRRDPILATMACKSAVKAGEPLPREKMEFLVEELFKTSNPSLCPHGRPIVVRIPKSQIEKGLRRPGSDR